MHSIFRTFAGTCLFVFFSLSARAYDLPPLNLGYTSYLDGAPPAGPGWYFQQYVQFYNNGKLKDGNGDDLLLPTSPTDLESVELDVTSAISQLIYLSLANSQSSRDGQLIKSLTVGLPMEVIQLNW